MLYGLNSERRDDNSFLRQSNELTIEEVARRAGMHRITASKYLAVLEAKGVIKHRQVGKAKLYSLIK